MGDQEPKYISLNDATRYCSYSQEYLSLRARTGKLRAIKIGRNWVTTKEWLEEYLGRAEEFKVTNGTKKIKEVRPPKNLPIEEDVFDAEPFEPPQGRPSQWIPMFTRAGVAVLTSVAIIFFAVGGVAFGKHGFFEMAARANTFAQEFGAGFGVGLQEAQESIEIFAKDFENAFVYGIQSPASVGEVAVEYVNWLKENIAAFPEVAPKAYADLNKKVEQGLAQDAQNFAQRYQELNDGLTFGLQNSARDIANTYENTKNRVRAIAKSVVTFVGPAEQKEEVREEVKEVVKEVVKEQVKEQVKEVVKEEEGVAVREVEVSRVTRIEPVREIVREVVSVDNAQLADFKQQIQGVLAWQGDIENLKQITAKLQSAPPSSAGVNAPIYISSGGLQVGGNATFSSLGVAGFASAESLGVGRSATLGTTSSDVLTVHAISTFFSDVTFRAGTTVRENLVVGAITSATETLANPGFLVNGDDLFVAGSAGIEGNVYTDGSFIAGVGTTTYGDGSITFTSITPSIVIGNTGTLSITDGTNTLFALVDNGTTATVTITGSMNISGTEALRLPVGTTAQRPATPGTGMLRYNTTNTTFEGYNGTVWSGLGGVIDVDQNTFIIAELTSGSNDDTLFFNTAGSERMRINSTGLVGIGTTSPSALLDVNNTVTRTISANANARVLNIQGAFTEAGSGTHARIAGLEITPPTITAGVATITDTASLYISNAPSATVTGTNYSLWVDAGTSRFDGQGLFGHAPTLAHTGTWITGVGTWNQADASLYSNPATATADSNLFALAVGGSVRFSVDAEGDIFGRNLVLEGSTTSGTTTVAGDLTVEGNTILGDAPGDTLTIRPQVISLINQATDIDIIDNSATSLTISQGANNYVSINTADAGAVMQFGNATTNPTFGFLGTGAVTIAGSAEGTNALVLTLGDARITDGDLVISAGEIIATADDTGGTSFSFTGVNTTGDTMGIVANALTTGTALAVSSTATAFDGELLTVSKTGASGSTAFTSDIANITYSQTFNGGVGLTSSGNVLDISRAITLDNVGNTHTVSGTLVSISDTMTQTAGTLTHTATVLSVTQNYASSTGTVLALSNAGTGMTISVSDDDLIGLGTAAGRIEFDDQATDEVNILNANVGIGDPTPSALLEVGNDTDSIQFSSVGDVTFVDADGAASITGPAGGALTVAAGASQALTLTANAASTWSTTSGNLTLSATAGTVIVGSGTGNITLEPGTDDIIATFGATSTFTIDAATTDNTQTTGVLEFNVDSVTDGNIGLNLNYIVRDAASNLAAMYGQRINATIDTDVSQNHTAYALYLNADSDDAASTIYGLFVDADADAGGEGTEYAAVFIDGNVGIGITGPTSLLHVVGSQPAAANPATNATTVLTVTGGKGGNASVVAIAGGIGAPGALTAGAGGDSTVVGTGTNTGGAGGGLTFAAGAGGAASGGSTANNGGAGGAVSITAGAAGTGGNAAGGTLTLNSGAVTGTGTSTINIGSANTTNLNIGTAGVADTITIGNNTSTTSLAFTSGTGSQTFTSSVATGTTTTSAFVFADTALTSGTLLYGTSSSLTSGILENLTLTGSSAVASAASSGSLLTLTSTTTGFTGATQRLAGIFSSGANSNASAVVQGLAISVTNTGTTSTNVGLYATASGATNNYAAIFDLGNVGIGTTSPAALLDLTSLATGANVLSTTSNSLTTGNVVDVNNTTSAFSGNALDISVGANQSDRVEQNVAGVFTNNTTEANSQAGTAFNLLNTGVQGAGDGTYFMDAATFSTLNFDIATAGVAVTNALEYCSVNAVTTTACDTWTAVTGLSDGTTNYTVDGKITWTDPAAAWITSVETAGNSGKWLRIRSTTSPTTAPTANFATISIATGNLLALSSNDTSKLVVTATGNVGIGTTGPGAALDVIGAANFGAGTARSLIIPAISALTGAGNSIAGSGAGAALTSGTNNTLFGVSAGNAIITASDNTFIGFRAGLLNTSVQNVAIGSNALDANTTGNQNVAIGFNALGANTTAVNNTAVGHEALLTNTTGAQNTAIGRSALENTTASGNTALGHAAGNILTTGAGNIILGYNADPSSATASNEFVAGATNSPITNVYFGEGPLDATPLAYTINGTGGSGTNIAGAALQLAGGRGTGTGTGGSIVFQTAAAGTTGTTLNSLTTRVTINSSGNVTFGSGTASTLVIPDIPALTGTGNSIAGSGAGAALTSGVRNTLFGLNAGNAFTTATDNTFIGYQAGLVNIATGNIAIGSGALDANTTGTPNIAIATDALGSNTTGSFNVAIGDGALTSNTTASNNLAIGYATLNSNVTGTDNIAIGRSALQANTASSNIAIGPRALDVNTTGAQNVAMGTDALGANTTASDNTGIGYVALSGNTTGNLNTAIGRSAMSGNTTGRDNTGLGYAALSANTIGNSNTALGRGALQNASASNNTAVGYFALNVATGNSNSALGYQAGDSITSGTGNIILGINADASSATANNEFVAGSATAAITNVYFAEGPLDASPLAYTINGGGGSGTDIAGAALQLAGGRGTGTGAGGNIVFQTSNAEASGTTLQSLTTKVTIAASGNVTFGSGTTSTLVIPDISALTGIFNSIAGSGAGAALTSGTNNTLFGVNAGNAIITVSNNTFIGFQAGLVNTSDGNTAIGSRALDANTTGQNNLAIGVDALGANTTGNNNVAIGADNTLITNTTGSRNVAIGRAALSAATGSDNTVVGYAAGDLLTTGAGNIILGSSADPSSATANNEFVAGSATAAITNVYFGEGPLDATPLAYTINGGGGSGTNIAGAALQLAGGRGTGTGAGGSIIFQTAAAGTTGATLNALSTRMTIDSAGNVQFSQATTISATAGNVVTLNDVGNITFEAGARDIILSGTTAPALEITNGTISYYAIDIRTSIPNEVVHTFDAANISTSSGGASDAPNTMARFASFQMEWTNGTQVTTLGRTVDFQPTTLTATVAKTIDAVATVAVQAPIESTNITLTDASAIRITDTNGTPTNHYGIYIENLTAGATDYAIFTAGTTQSSFGGNVGIGTTSPVAGAGLTIAPAARTSGTPSLLTITGPADTTLAASTEAIDVNLNLARTVQFNTGAITTQRAVRIAAPTYGFLAASTVTDATTLAISGAPIAGTNATLTNSSALRISAGAVAAGTTNAYGLYIDAPTGASNNYAAVFPTGNVGIGTTSPVSLLDLTSSATTTNVLSTTSNSLTTGNILDINNTTSAFSGNALDISVGANQSDRVEQNVGGTFTNNTTEANSQAGTAFNLLNTGVQGAGDGTYFMDAATFSTLNFDIATAGVAVTNAVEYCSVNAVTTTACDTWTAVTGLSDGTTNYTVDGKITWTDPTTAWITSVETAGNSGKWLRIRSTTSPTTAPTANFATISIATGNLLALSSNDTSKLVLTATGNVGIGTTSPGAALDVKGAANFGAGTARSLIIPAISALTGTGNSIAGSGAGAALTSGTNNTLFGFNAGNAIVSQNDNTFIGYQAGLVNTAVGNTAVGARALDANIIGTENVAIGRDALGANTAGSNTAVGFLALTLNTTGASNTAIGDQALGANTTASNNTAVGYAALNTNTTGGGNTAFGRGAIQSSGTSVSNSTGVGVFALNSVTGNNNTALGYQAGDSITSGTGNIILGIDADASSATANNEFVAGSATAAITNVYFGEGPLDATPLAYTINGGGGSGTNIAGAALQLAGGRGTGTGAGGSIVFQTAAAGTTGTTLNALSTRMTIDSAGNLQFSQATTISTTAGALTLDATTITTVDTAQTVASAAGATLDAFQVQGDTITISGVTNITTATGFNLVDIKAPTYSNASITVTNAATAYIGGAPVASGGMAISNAYALWVDAGNARFDGNIISGAGDPADAGVIQLGNAEIIGWEASPAGTDVTLTVDASEIMQASGTFNAVTLTEGGTGVPNTGDNLSVFAATTSLQLLGVISDETGSGALVFGTAPAFTTSITTPSILTASGALTLDATTITTVDTAQTVASAAGATLDAFQVQGDTITISGVTNITTATGFNLVDIKAPTYSNASITVTNAATAYIGGAPVASGGMAITNTYSLWVDAGTSRFDGAVALDAQQTLTADSTTPSVSAGSHFITANTVATLISNFTSGFTGQIIVIEVNDANTTYDCTANANFNCGTVDLVGGTGDVLTWIRDATVWNLISWMDTSKAQTGADIAELFPSVEALEPGDLVVADTGFPVHVKKSSSRYERQILGIVSTQPGLILQDANPLTSSGQAYPIALAGRAPLKVSLENGPIGIGDYLTSSSTLGVAMRATSAGNVVGIALESSEQCNNVTIEQCKVMVFIQLGWQGSSELTVQEQNGQLVNLNPEQLRTGLASLGLVVNPNGTLTVDTLKTRQLCVGNICVTEDQFRQVFGVTPTDSSTSSFTDSSIDSSTSSSISSSTSSSIDSSTDSSIDSSTSSSISSSTSSSIDSSNSSSIDSSTTTAEPTPTPTPAPVGSFDPTAPSNDGAEPAPAIEESPVPMIEQPVVSESVSEPVQEPAEQPVVESSL